MIAWRMQNAAGEGPYKAGLLGGLSDAQSKKLFGHIHGSCKCHPEPVNEFGFTRFGMLPPEWMFEFLCGFFSRKQALAWFPLEIHANLWEIGFSLMKVEVDGIYCGSRSSRQVVFYRNKHNAGVET